IGRESVIKTQKGLRRDNLKFYVYPAPGRPALTGTLKSVVSIPLSTVTTREGIMFLGSTKEDAFSAESMLILNILAEELSLFLENERVKRALADAKNRLESMLNCMCEGMIALNEKFEVTLVNPSAKELLGLSDVRIGMPVWEMIEAKDMIELINDMSKVGPDVFTRDINLILPDKARAVKAYAAAVTDSLGRAGGWMILLTDVTKEKEVDRMKSEFISTTSHELRTPLAAIRESVALILDGTTGALSPQQDKFLGIAKRNIERLSNLINDILDLSKIETGKMELKKEYTDPAEIVKRALEPMQFLAKNVKVNLVLDVRSAMPVIYCDPDRVTQVVVNLVGNAIKFTPAGGSVTVGLIQESRAVEGKGGKEEFVRVSVTDTGSGIDKKDFEKLFTRFGQLDGSLTRRPGGTGLGLAICKELVNMHGGNIWVESELGVGSTFSFILPLEAA
ncbi:MAG: ATP-binding protein, partial [Candidatus Omnitrophota bacterium]